MYTSSKIGAVIVPAAAVILWIGTGIIAALDWSGAVSGRACAAGAISAAVTVAAWYLTSRRDVRTVTAAVQKAPQEQYWRGYGDASEDALGD